MFLGRLVFLMYNNNMRSLIVALLLWFCPLIIHAITMDGWSIHVETPVIAYELIKEQEMQTYTGEMTLVRFERFPRKGYVYVLVPIQAERVPSIKTPLRIEEIHVKQGDKVFNRINDDSFLIDYDILPFTQLSTNLEKSKGTLLFEIPLHKNKIGPLSILYKTKVIQTLQ